MPAIRRQSGPGPELEGDSHAPAPSHGSRRSARERRTLAPYAFPSVDSDETESATSTGGAKRRAKSKRTSGNISFASSRVQENEDEDSSDDEDLDIVPLPSAKKGISGPTFAGPITVSGVRLRPTVAFDAFWKFAAERKAVDDKRRAGLPAPWTADPILQKHFFCNTFRVLDKGCQFLIKEVIEKGSQDPEEIVFRVILFNLFTRIETWQLLDRKLGPLKWKTYSHEKYMKVLREAVSNGQAIYTCAFFKPKPKLGEETTYENHLCFLEILMDNKLYARLLGASFMADVFEYLVSFPSLGAFSAYQLMLNLSYTKVLNFHPNDFVVSGPGSVSGLRKIFGKSWTSGLTDHGFHQEVMRYFVDNQDYHFQRLGLKLSGLGPKRFPMDLADVEHTLCEVDKYCRMAFPSMKGKRTEMGRRFDALNPSSRPTQYVLPKAWNHPSRTVLRIRPEKHLELQDKRYIVECLLGHDDIEDRGRVYLVHWAGFKSKDDTWEPENMLLDEVPAMVEEYVKQAGISHSPEAEFRPY